MENLKVRKSTLLDCVILKDNLRDEHKREIDLYGLNSYEKELTYSYLVSQECFTVVADCLPIYMFGVTAGQKEPEGIVWALGSSRVDNYKKEFFAKSRQYIDLFFELYPNYHILYNFIDAEYKQGIKFAKMLGGKLFDPAPLGLNNELMLRVEFYRR